MKDTEGRETSIDSLLSSIRVCVTGVAGYIGAWLVNKRLQKGYIVHATLRYLGDFSLSLSLIFKYCKNYFVNLQVMSLRLDF